MRWTCEPPEAAAVVPSDEYDLGQEALDAAHSGRSIGCHAPDGLVDLTDRGLTVLEPAQGLNPQVDRPLDA